MKRFNFTNSRAIEICKYLLFAFILVLGINHVMRAGAGSAATTSTDSTDSTEGFENGDLSCPNILMQKGPHIFLYNSKKAKVPGVNPIQFENLEEYTEFIDWQRANGIRCPVLYMRESYDTQGKSVYKIQNDPIEPLGGLAPVAPARMMDASRGSPTYNKNSYPGMDPDNQYIGAAVDLDMMESEPTAGDSLVAQPSGNPMDSNWGGVGYTTDLVDSGVYDGNTVRM